MGRLSDIPIFKSYEDAMIGPTFRFAKEQDDILGSEFLDEELEASIQLILDDLYISFDDAFNKLFAFFPESGTDAIDGNVEITRMRLSAELDQHNCGYHSVHHFVKVPVILSKLLEQVKDEYREEMEKSLILNEIAALLHDIGHAHISYRQLTNKDIPGRSMSNEEWSVVRSMMEFARANVIAEHLGLVQSIGQNHILEFTKRILGTSFKQGNEETIKDELKGKCIETLAPDQDEFRRRFSGGYNKQNLFRKLKRDYKPEGPAGTLLQLADIGGFVIGVWEFMNNSLALAEEGILPPDIEGWLSGCIRFADPYLKEQVAGASEYLKPEYIEVLNRKIDDVVAELYEIQDNNEGKKDMIIRKLTKSQFRQAKPSRFLFVP